MSTVQALEPGSRHDLRVGISPDAPDEDKVKDEVGSFGYCHSYETSSRYDGPGLRLVLFVSGCLLRCTYCHNPDTWHLKDGTYVSVDQVLRRIGDFAPSIQALGGGLTISGGEPFQQYEALIVFLYLVKTKTKLNTQIYSGYTLEELDALFPDKLFYKYIDTLVDGRYLRELHDDHNLKGSANQNYYSFVNGLPVKQDKPGSSNKWSLLVNDEKQIYMAGIPKRNELDELCQHLKKSGIYKSFK